MTAGLAELPTEVLSSIVVHLRTANALLHLSLTCKRLHDYIETDGFRVFVKNCFPSIHAPPHWKDAARSLTDLSRSWDRKAFSARYLIPPTKDFGRSTRLYERRQTMGYQPVIDSYAEQTGSSWASQKEVLAWGAGAKLIVRMINPDFGKGRMTGSVNQSSLWMEVAGGKEGRDDITSVNLLRPNQKAPDTPEQIIIGRANGELERIQTPYQDKASKSLSKYFTGGRHVRSAAITTTRDPLLAASLSDGTVVVYPVHGVEPETRIIEPFGDVSIKTVQKFGKIWTTRFLAPALLAVGSGMSKKPLNIYNTGPDRISNIPLRSYQPLADDWWYDAESGKEAPINSVYSIAPLELSSSGGGNDGEVFLSGWFAGAIQLHDLRSPQRQVAVFSDPIDPFSAVYSLLPVGRERFLAGSARHSILKVFDLRMPGGKVYFASDAEPCRTLDPDKRYHSASEASSCCKFHRQSHHVRKNYSVFLRAPNSVHRDLGRRPPKAESPVYSLSSPAPYSSRIFAGLENEVVQIDIGSMMQHGSDRDTTTSSNHYEHCLALSLYEHTEDGTVLMATQRPVGQQGRSQPPGWDERWAYNT